MNVNKNLWSALLVFMPVAIVAIILAQSNFAIGDDYHSLGFYFSMTNADFLSAVSVYWKSPFMAGRPIAGIIELFPLSMMDSINQFFWVRYLHLVIFALIFSLFWKVIKKCNGGTVAAAVIALFMFTLPGLWHMYIMNYGSSMLLAVLSTLFGALLTVKNTRLSIKQWLFFSAFAAFAVYNYQPAWPLLFVGLAGKLLSTINRSGGDFVGNADDAVMNSVESQEIRNYSNNFIVALFIVLGVFISNFLLVKFGYDSQRLHTSIEWFGQLRYIIYDLLPITIYPWLYLWFPEQHWLKVLSWATFLVSFAVVIFVLIRGIHGVRGAYSRINFSEYIVILAIATSLIPMTLGMYLFTDQAIAFRRVQFASMLFWFTFLFSLACFIRTTKIRQYFKFLKYVFLIVIMAYIFAFGYFLNVGTVQLASREWNAAICASKISPLSEPPRVNKAMVLLPKPYPEAWSTDEFQVRTFSFPTGGMMVWMAHLEARKTLPDFSRWNVDITEDDTSHEWENAYINCLSQTK